MDNINLLYRELLIYYAQITKYKGKVSHPNIKYTGKNPACGDEVEIEGFIDENLRLKDIKINAHGCFISRASSNIMAQIIEGKLVNEIYEIVDDYKQYITSKKNQFEKEENKELEILEGVRKFPTRIKCALIGWETLLEALKSYVNGRDKG